MIEISIEFLA